MQPCKYKELDGKVDAFGVGGADLGLMVDDKWYRLYSVEKMVRFIKQTPVVDGTGLKNSLENKAAPFVEAKLGDYIQKNGGKKAFVMTGADRWGLAHGFVKAGYECTFGDLMFSLGIPIALHTEKQLKTLACDHDASGGTPAVRMGLSDRRETGRAQAEVSEMVRVG